MDRRPVHRRSQRRSERSVVNLVKRASVARLPNDGADVLIQACGTPAAIDAFVPAIGAEAPRLARIDRIEREACAMPDSTSGFVGARARRESCRPASWPTRRRAPTACAKCEIRWLGAIATRSRTERIATARRNLLESSHDRRRRDSAPLRRPLCGPPLRHLRRCFSNPRATRHGRPATGRHL